MPSIQDDGMFDLPEVKRVRRADLYTSHNPSRSSSPERRSSPSNPQLELALQEKLAAIYGPVVAAPIPPPQKPAHDPIAEEKHKNEEQEFEFRLFSAAPRTQDAQTSSETAKPLLQKIILDDSDSEEGEGGFVSRPRPLSYFVRAKAEGAREEEFKLMAVGGDTVLEWSRKRAWGLEVPWRVRILKVANPSNKALGKGGKDSNETSTDDSLGDVVMGTVIEDEGKKKRIGKKRRILLRERKRKREAIEEVKRKESELKAEHDKENRTRKNREKKVRRKMKEKAEKAKKTEAKANNGDAVVVEVGKEDVAIDQGQGAIAENKIDADSE